jgi:hypothetical protein
LKPDVLPSLTEVRVGSTASAHLFRRTGCTQMLLPCENDQAKLDPFSRLACSTNLSKILSSYRLSGLVGSRPRLLRRGVLELVAHSRLCTFVHILAFLREPFKHIELDSLCQAPISLSESADRKGGAAQNIKERPANNARTTRVRRR